jgi:hypothetical protein
MLDYTLSASGGTAVTPNIGLALNRLPQVVYLLVEGYMNKARTAADTHPIGISIRAQLKIYQQQDDFLTEQLDALTGQIAYINKQKSKLIDRYYYLTLCLDHGEEYSDRGFIQFQAEKGRPEN